MVLSVALFAIRLILPAGLSIGYALRGLEDMGGVEAARERFVLRRLLSVESRMRKFGKTRLNWLLHENRRP